MEFHAIILAGGGKSFYPFESKALMPLATSTLLGNAVDWCVAAQIKQISIVCDSMEFDSIQQCISTLECKTNVQLVACSEDGSVAAVNSLDINSDFIVLSVDSYTQVPPHYLLDTHRLLLPTLTCLIADAKLDSLAVAKRQANNLQFIGLDQQSNLLHLSTEDPEDEPIPLRHSLLDSKTKFTLFTHLRDTHIYIFRRWVAGWLKTMPNLVSLQRDVVPLLIKAQYAGSLWRERLGISTYIFLVDDWKRWCKGSHREER